ncbi:putative ATP-dependent carboligase [Burkholderiales bacterium JOSHI_001]|nr:putative ATP-dependent carboligase [Burkholderiales bacterium JOSHI_001]
MSGHRDAGPTVAVAGLSARWLATSAARAGWGVVALDAFGDADTRAASRAWLPIAQGLELDEAQFLSALDQAHQRHGAVAWLYGSGFENRPEWVARAAARWPLWGQDADVLRRVRDPEHFFATLRRLGLPHPATRFTPPDDPQGWIAKSATGSGGWHIREAAATDFPDDAYWQRLQPGTPGSALYLADGRRAQVVALNRLLVEPLGDWPFVYRGAIGPLHDGALEAAIQQALDALVPAFGLAGLGSLDFIATDPGFSLLEINPRPSASMALHDGWAGGLLGAHVQALQGQIMPLPPRPKGLQGERVVWTGSALTLTAAQAEGLAARGHLHDRPSAGMHFEPGQPLCSVSASGDTVDEVLQSLRRREAEVLAACGAITMHNTHEETL